jgi:hypothetical protein
VSFAVPNEGDAGVLEVSGLESRSSGKVFIALAPARLENLMHARPGSPLAHLHASARDEAKICFVITGY